MTTESVTDSGPTGLKLPAPLHELLIPHVEPVTEGQEDQQRSNGDKGRPQADPSQVADQHYRNDRLGRVDHRTWGRLTGSHLLAEHTL